MRNIQILNALKRLGASDLANMHKFTPYMLDANFRVEQSFSGLQGLSATDFSRTRYQHDNHSVTAWFAELKDDFHVWREQTKYTVVSDLRIQLTGGRVFNASYPEEPVHCAIVSENFKSFLQFCVFINIHYAQHQRILAGKNDSGIPEMIVKGKRGRGGFQCEKLIAKHPEAAVPELHISYMNPVFYGKYNALEVRFFDAMSDDEVDSYLHNMRYFRHLLNQASRDVKYVDKLAFRDLQQVIALLDSTHQPDISNLRSQSPEFNRKVLNSVISFATLSLGRDAGLTSFSTKGNMHEAYAKIHGCEGDKPSGMQNS